MKTFNFMKKLFFGVLVSVVGFGMVSCTEHGRVQNWGSDMTVTLPKGYKLDEVTWKENSLWYLIEEMDSDYIPKKKIFIEESRLGIMEGTVTFVETK